jgi:hypothetical protein
MNLRRSLHIGIATFMFLVIIFRIDQLGTFNFVMGSGTACINLILRLWRVEDK